MLRQESAERWKSYEAELKDFADRVREERDHAKYFDSNDKNNIRLLLEALMNAHRVSASAVLSLDSEW